MRISSSQRPPHTPITHKDIRNSNPEKRPGTYVQKTAILISIHEQASVFPHPDSVGVVVAAAYQAVQEKKRETKSKLDEERLENRTTHTSKRWQPVERDPPGLRRGPGCALEKA